MSHYRSPTNEEDEWEEGEIMSGDDEQDGLMENASDSDLDEEMPSRMDMPVMIANSAHADDGGDTEMLNASIADETTPVDTVKQTSLGLQTFGGDGYVLPDPNNHTIYHIEHGLVTDRFDREITETDFGRPVWWTTIKAGGLIPRVTWDVSEDELGRMQRILNDITKPLVSGIRFNLKRFPEKRTQEAIDKMLKRGQTIEAAFTIQ